MKSTYVMEGSEGARIERKAIRTFIRRKLKQRREDTRVFGLRKGWTQGYELALRDVLEWVLLRHNRFDKRKGGLGRK